MLLFINKNELKISHKKQNAEHLPYFIILTFINTFSILGHDINYQFTSISIAEGLSQNTVQTILLDKKGIMDREPKWFELL